MTITIQAQKELRRYTFIEKVEMVGTTIKIYYNGGKVKQLAYRADIKKLIKIIQEIKKEINFQENKNIRDVLVKKELNKPLIFTSA